MSKEENVKRVSVSEGESVKRRLKVKNGFRFTERGDVSEGESVKRRLKDAYPPLFVFRDYTVSEGESVKRRLKEKYIRGEVKANFEVSEGESVKRRLKEPLFYLNHIFRFISFRRRIRKKEIERCWPSGG